jgi:hypothetical protein
MKHFCRQRTLVAGVALMAASFFSPAQAQADWTMLGHGYAHSHSYAYSYAYQAPSYYYVPMVVSPYYQAPVRYAPAAPAKKAENTAKKEQSAESKAQPTVSPTYLYSNYTYAHPNPVVMVYPPMVYGYGQPLVMW